MLPLLSIYQEPERAGAELGLLGAKKLDAETFAVLAGVVGAPYLSLTAFSTLSTEGAEFVV